MKGARGKVDGQDRKANKSSVIACIYTYSREKNGVMAIAVLFIGQLILVYQPTNYVASTRKRWAFFIIWRLSLSLYWLSCITTHAAS